MGNSLHSLSSLFSLFSHVNLTSLQSSIGISFRSKDLLEQALVHRSYLNENPHFHLSHNERLEFLGDAVLELVVTQALYEKFPEKPEGELTSLRAALVNSKMLSAVSEAVGLNEYLLLSRGEAKDTGRARQFILANTLEALIGAMYLDQGYALACEFITRTLMPRLDEVLTDKLYKDPKSLFQEEAQERVGITPSYEVMAEWGPDHDKHFTVGVYLDREIVAQGEGPSKQVAQEQAAKNGLLTKGWG